MRNPIEDPAVRCAIGAVTAAITNMLAENDDMSIATAMAHVTAAVLSGVYANFDPNDAFPA